MHSAYFNIQVYGEEISDYMEMVTSISRTVSILIFVYILSAIPLIYLISGKGQPNLNNSTILEFIRNLFDSGTHQITDHS